MKSLNFLLISLCWMVSIAHAKSVVRFSSQLEISHQAQYSLLDIVEVSKPTPALLKKLWQTSIPSSWTLGPRWSLSSQQVLKLLKTSKLSQKGVEFIVPTEVSPKKSADILSREHLRRVITYINQAQCQSCEFKVEFHNIPKVLLTDWEWDPFAAPFRGSFTTMIRMPDTKWSGWLTGVVRWKSSVPVLRRTASYQQTLQENDLVMTEKDVTFQTDFLSEIKDVAGQDAARTLSAGQVLVSADLKKKAMVRRGQVVKTIVGESDYEIALMAMAEETGSQGDLVKIKNMESKKILTAVVIDQGVVRLQ